MQSTRSPRKSKTKLPKGVYLRKVRGQEYFLVSLGRDPQGKQKWKSCTTLDEAKTQRELYERTKEQEGEGLWLLSPAKRADAVSAFEVLKDNPEVSLVQTADYYLKHYLAIVTDQNISQLVEKWIDEQRGSGVRQGTLTDLVYRLKPIKTRFGGRLANGITVQDIRDWDKAMQKQGLGLVSRKNFLNRASSFFRWAVANKFALSNPVDPAAVRRPKISRGEILFYSVEQCEKILKVFTKHDLTNYAVLGLFCGIRPDEIRRLRSHHFKIDGETIVITLNADVTKTVWRRVIELKRGTLIGDCVWAWLGGNGKLELPEVIAPAVSSFKGTFQELRKELGFDWIQDGLRHTAASYALKATSYEAVEQMLGHNNRYTLKNHYQGLTTEGEAKRFYALRPS